MESNPAGTVHFLTISHAPLITLHDIKPLRQTKPSAFDTWVAGLLALLPIALFWAVWAIYAVNVPKWDDHALKAFLVGVDHEQSFFGKVNVFFSQHNEHRIVYDRLITWLDYHLFGKFSYVHLMVVGNLSLLGLLFIFDLVLSQSTNQSTPSKSIVYTWTDGLRYLPPVAFLLFNLSQWENMFWGMAALQNFTVVLWIVWGLYQLAFAQRIGLALIIAVAAVLTSGNGILIWPAGLLLLILRMTQQRARLAQLISWVLVGTVTIGLYFWHYAKSASNPPNPASASDLLIGWLAFNGSAAETFSIRPVLGVCVLAGGLNVAMLIGIGLYILKKWLDRQRLSSLDYFFLGVAAFLISTSVVVAWTRTSFGIPTLITSRYKLYPLLSLALLYTYLVGQLRNPAKTWIRWAGLAFGILLMGSSYLTFLGETIGLHKYLLTEQFNWTHLSNRATVTVDSVSERYLDRAPAFYTDASPAIFAGATSGTIPLSVQHTADAYMITNTTVPTLGLGDNGAYLLARSAKRSYLIPVRQNQRAIRSALFRPATLFTTGFQATISPAALDAGQYQLLVLLVSNNTYNLYATHQSIDSAGPPSTPLSKNW